MPIAILVLVLDIFCIVHCARNNKSFWWIIAIIFLSPLGGFAYLLLEYLPEYTGSGRPFGGGRAAGRSAFQPLNNEASGESIEALKEALDISDTVYNRERLADAYVQKKRYGDAMAEYERCLTGRYADDTGILFKYAESSFEHGDYARTIELLDRFMSLTDTRRNEVLLLQARAHEFLKQPEQARRIYEQLHAGFPTLEAKGHYARFLVEQNEKDKAKPLIQEIVASEQELSRYQREAHWEIIAFAKRLSKQI